MAQYTTCDCGVPYCTYSTQDQEENHFSFSRRKGRPPKKASSIDAVFRSTQTAMPRTHGAGGRNMTLALSENFSLFLHYNSLGKHAFPTLLVPTETCSVACFLIQGATEGLSKTFSEIFSVFGQVWRHLFNSKFHLSHYLYPECHLALWPFFFGSN